MLVDDNRGPRFPIREDIAFPFVDNSTPNLCCYKVESKVFMICFELDPIATTVPVESYGLSKELGRYAWSYTLINT